ncbi:MAG: aspartyl beta-hydroxylase [Gammaproteobacteria bacterium]|nr:aspartyl beta-hydroxylase [Gammaproteobacteria bacterium]
MNQSTTRLIESATAAAKAGRHAEAESLWAEVLKLEPLNPKALFSAGVHAMQRGDFARARDLLLQAHRQTPEDLLVLMTIASASRFLQDRDGELEAIDATLVRDPYYLPGLLARGYWLETHSTIVAAATTFRNALRVAPPEPQWPDFLREQLRHASDVVQRYSRDYERHLLEQIDSLTNELPAAIQTRWREAASIMAGRTRPYHSESNQLHVPRLPAVTFYDRELFPWAAALEARTAEIRAELENALQHHTEGFAPYIGYRPGEPVNQWRELNHSKRWSAYNLWRAGEPVEDNLGRCPITRDALRAVEMAEIGGLCPNAMFSALAPRTRIPPHHGETNARVVVHLPLIVPPGCRYRVGFDECDWQVGRILAFDDTLEHEARNDGDELRVVLIFDAWNPLLTAAERKLVTTMALAARSFGR